TAALNAAIQTTPPPRTNDDRLALFTLNGRLFDLYLKVSYFDLARDRLQAMLNEVPAQVTGEELARLREQLAGLNQQVRQIQDNVNEATIEQQLGPLQRAALARSQGAPGLALAELEEAERTGVSPAIVRPQLVDLYCDTGQPEKAHDLLNTGNVE